MIGIQAAEGWEKATIEANDESAAGRQKSWKHFGDVGSTREQSRRQVGRRVLELTGECA